MGFVSLLDRTLLAEGRVGIRAEELVGSVESPDEEIAGSIEVTEEEILDDLLYPAGVEALRWPGQ